MNICILVGRSTKDPTVRMSAEGTQVATFSLAVDNGFGDKRKAHFFEMVGFGKAAESISKYIRQGTKIIVQCQPQQNIWTDNEGRKHYDVNFVIQSWEFAESKKNADTTTTATPTDAPVTVQYPGSKTGNDGFMSVPQELDEELPFA